MDELLFERVKQLKEIDDRLEHIEHQAMTTIGLDRIAAMLRSLRNDLAAMIAEAERQHAAF